MKLKEQQVKELDQHVVQVKRIEPEKEAVIEARRAAVAERYLSLEWVKIFRINPEFGILRLVSLESQG